MAQRSQLVHPRQVEGFSTLPAGTLKAYFLVTKPVMVCLLVFTGVVGFALASQGTFPTGIFLLTLLALTTGCAGANTLTCYIDRDIDAIMERTRDRPIPSLQISPEKALIFGLVLVVFALGFSFSLNWLTFVIIFAGIINNVFIYSLWLKRRTPLNIFIGGIAGGLPVVAGYAAYANAITAESLFLAALVIIWIPVHIWSIALKHKEDYMKAHVPMLPVVVTGSRTVQFINLMASLLVIFSLVPALLGWFGAIYLYSAAILGGILFLMSLFLAFSPTEKRAWMVFKMSSIYLGLLFLSLLVDLLIFI